MLLSNIAAAVVCLLCVLGLLRIIYVNKRDMQEEIDRLNKQREQDTKTLMTLSEAVNEMYDRLNEKEESLAEREKAVRMWDEGVSNILNYSLDVARGEKR